MPKEKLSIQVADIYSVHVDDVNVFEPSQCQVGQNLATKASSSDHQDFCFIAQEIFNLMFEELKFILMTDSQ